MEKTRTKKAFYNMVSSIASEAIALICSLILPRLILTNYGSAYNGISSSATQILGAVSIFAIGVTGSTRVALYKSLAANDIERTSRIIKSTELYMRKVGYGLLVLWALLIVFYPIVIDTGYSWTEVAPLIFAAGIGAAGQYFFGMTYGALLMADQRLYISNIIYIVTSVLNVVIAVVLIKAGCSIQIVKLVSSFILVLNPIARAMYVRHNYRLDTKSEPDETALAMRRDVMAHSIASIVHDYTDIIVLTIFCSVKVVSVYTVYNLVMVALKKTQTVFTSGTESIFGSMWANQEYDKIKENLSLFEYIMAVFVSVVFASSYVLILPFVSLYTKGVTDIEYVLPVFSVVIISAQMFFAFRAPYLAVIHGAGHYKQTKNGAYAEAIINLTASIIFVQFFGIVGVAIGTLLANVFRTVQYAIYIDDHLVSRGKHCFVLRILWAVANVVLTAFICNLLQIETNAYDGWREWVISAVFSVIIGTAVVLVSSLLFYRKDLYGTKKLAGRLFKRKKA